MPEPESLLLRYTLEEDPVERAALYCELYAEKIRNGTEMWWEVPSVRAAVLDGVAETLRRRGKA